MVATLANGRAGEQHQVGGADVYRVVACQVKDAAGGGNQGHLGAACAHFTQGDVTRCGFQAHIAVGAANSGTSNHGDGCIGFQVNGRGCEQGADVPIGMVLQDAVFGQQGDVAGAAGHAGVEGEVGRGGLIGLASTEQDVARGKHARRSGRAGVDRDATVERGQDQVAVSASQGDVFLCRIGGLSHSRAIGADPVVSHGHRAAHGDVGGLAQVNSAACAQAQGAHAQVEHAQVGACGFTHTCHGANPKVVSNDVGAGFANVSDRSASNQADVRRAGIETGDGHARTAVDADVATRRGGAVADDGAARHQGHRAIGGVGGLDVDGAAVGADGKRTLADGPCVIEQGDMASAAAHVGVDRQGARGGVQANVARATRANQVADGQCTRRVNDQMAVSGRAHARLGGG